MEILQIYFSLKFSFFFSSSPLAKNVIEILSRSSGSSCDSEKLRAFVAKCHIPIEHVPRQPILGMLSNAPLRFREPSKIFRYSPRTPKSGKCITQSVSGYFQNLSREPEIYQVVVHMSLPGMALSLHRHPFRLLQITYD
jgi:hypothetical protein